MNRVLLAAARQSWRICSLGIVTGAIAGWIGYAQADHDSRAVGTHAAPWYWLFAVGGPALLAVLSRRRVDTPTPAVDRGTQIRGFVLLLGVGVVGTGVGSLLHLAMSLLLPAAIGIGWLNDTEARNGLLAHFPIPAAIVAFVLTIAVAAWASLGPKPTRRATVDRRRT